MKTKAVSIDNVIAEVEHKLHRQMAEIQDMYGSNKWLRDRLDQVSDSSYRLGQLRLLKNAGEAAQAVVGVYVPDRD